MGTCSSQVLGGRDHQRSDRPRGTRAHRTHLRARSILEKETRRRDQVAARRASASAHRRILQIDAEYEHVRNQRGLLRTALGYAHRQRGPLTRFYDDGRLRLDNNASERELRRIAVGRKNWLFVGSDDHAQAAGNLLTLIASARLHSLDPEAYLRDLFRVLPYWPRERFLELCPRDWIATRARLDPAELERELGPLTVPESTSSSTEQPAAR